ncbi:hypothetical protein ACYJ1Y_12685 [Natrialbaceae archaeon A-gly3]
MSSLESVETRFYELLVVATSLSFVAALFGSRWLSEYVGILPLASPAFGLAVTGGAVVVLALLIRQAGRYNRP